MLDRTALEAAGRRAPVVRHGSACGSTPPSSRHGLEGCGRSAMATRVPASSTSVPASRRHDGPLRRPRRIAEIDREGSAACRFLQILHGALIAGVVGDRKLKSAWAGTPSLCFSSGKIRRASVSGWMTTVVSCRLRQFHRDRDRAVPDRHGQRAIVQTVRSAPANSGRRGRRRSCLHALATVTSGLGPDAMPCARQIGFAAPGRVPFNMDGQRALGEGGPRTPRSRRLPADKSSEVIRSIEVHAHLHGLVCLGKAAPARNSSPPKWGSQAIAIWRAPQPRSARSRLRQNASKHH